MKKGTKLIILCVVMLLFVGGYLLLKYLPGESEVVGQDTNRVVVKYEDVKNLTEITYSMAGTEMDFVNKDGTWVCKFDEEYPLKTDAVDAMAAALSEITADRLVSENLDNAADYGIDMPTFSFTAHFGETSYTVNLGDFNELTSSYYMNIEGEQKIYLLAEEFFDNFNYTLYELAIDDTLDSVDTTTVTSIKTTQNGKEFVLTSDKSGTEFDSDEYVYIKKTSDGNVSSLGAAESTDYISGVCEVALNNVVDFKPNEEKLSQYGLDTESVVKVEISYEKEVENGSEDTDAKVTSVESSEFCIGRNADENGNASYFAYIPGSDLIYSVLNSDGSAFFDAYDVLSVS